MLALFLAAALPVAPIPFDDARWKIEAQESRVERYLGRDALFIRAGGAWLDGVSFQNGIIEFDVAMPAENGFHGFAFRAQDRRNYENFYLRAHLPDKPDATQYQPLFNGVAGWQIYSDPRFTLPVAIAHDRWMHVRAAFRGKRLEVSVDGKTLVFPALVRPIAAGTVGFLSSAASAHYANVIVRSNEIATDEGGDGAKAPETPQGIVTRWRISSPFAEGADPKDLHWNTLDATVRGIANIATTRSRTNESNTVFAAVTLRARNAGPVRVRFGFSDRVVVYLNGRPIYRGDDRFQSRDYRFLGTVGLYDELILPLNRGDNEVRLAVSEDFGGWAVTMQLVDAALAEVVP